MSATTSAEGLVFVDRLMSKPWLRSAVKSVDKLACCALDAFDASWEILKDPVTDVVENAAFSSLGQFTIGCLETGVGMTANVLSVVLPVGEKTKTPKEKGIKRVSSRPDIVDPKKKTVTRERKGRPLEPVRTASAAVVFSLRDLKAWLKSLKLEDCGHCAKRRKVIASRRLGPYGMIKWLAGYAMLPLKVVRTTVIGDVMKLTLPLSNNEAINKSPVRPKSATEKRKCPELDVSDDEDEDDVRHTFHDDLDDYKSDEDEDYQLPEKDDSTDSDEYVAGETESDVSIDEVSQAPLKERDAKKGVKLVTINGNAKDADKTNDKGKKAEDAKKAADKSQNKDKTQNQSAKKPETQKDAGSSAKKPESPKVAGSSVDKQSGNAWVTNGQKSGKDSGKSQDGKKGATGSMMKQTSPKKLAVGM